MRLANDSSSFTPVHSQTRAIGPRDLHLAKGRGQAKDVVAVLEELTSVYPAPTFIRSDNGPEFIAHALRKWCQSSGTSTAYIEPGSPWQNGFVESFNSRFRDEFLNTELFATVTEVQGLANRWPRDD